MKWARQQRFGTVPLTALVNAIAARADKHGTVWAAQETLAADIGSTARYVRKLLAKAERLGIMNRKYRSGGARGRLTDTMTLEMHKAFRLTASDVRKAGRWKPPRYENSQPRSSRHTSARTPFSGPRSLRWWGALRPHLPV